MTKIGDTSTSRERVCYKRTEKQSDGSSIRYAQKRPKRFTEEDLKVIETFYLRINKGHPDYIFMQEGKEEFR